MTPRYRVERVLGRGRHAGIWLARDRQQEKLVALKVAQQGSLDAEYDAMAHCAGAHVLEAYECGRLPDARAFIAMEYVPRGDITRQAPGAYDVARVLLGAAQALATVHAAGWVHRDVKPAHLLLGEDGEVVLSDFGSSCRTRTRDRTGQPRVVGTPRYAAPEQIEGAPAAPSADVYSLGVCAWELLAGRPPFRGETLTELFSQHVRAPVPRLPREAAAWQALVDALLAKDPLARPQDGAAVLACMTPMIGEYS